MLKIGNKNKKINAQLCKGLAATIGFMFQFRSSYAKVLVLDEAKKAELHMFFVFFPIYAIFLNDRNRVVETALLKPFTFYSSKKKAKYVLEMPARLARGFRVRVGDKIKFIN